MTNMQNLQKIFILILGVIFWTNDSAGQQWNYKTPMPTARKGMAVAVLQGKIWVIGGSKMGHHVLDVVEVYDPATDSWDTQIPNINQAREDATAKVWNGKIYLFGGEKDNQLIGEVEAYDPATGNWQVISTLPTPRRGMASVVHDSTIWLIGGGNSQNTIYDLIEIYHPQNNSWSTLAAHLNTARANPMAGEIDETVFVFGGHFFGPVASFEKYDPNTQSWQNAGNMPYHCMSAGYTVAGDSAWIIGGLGQMGTVLDKVQIFYQEDGNPAWVEGVPLNTPRRELVAAAVNNTIYAIGGRGEMGGMFYDTVEAFNPIVSIYDEPVPYPEDFALLRNFPNPFNSMTTVSVTLPEKDRVQLKVYDPLGREIGTLYQGTLLPGTHAFPLSFSDFSGVELATGVYLLQLNGKKFDVIHKLILAK